MRGSWNAFGKDHAGLGRDRNESGREADCDAARHPDSFEAQVSGNV
jgi:hypothetical protein